MKMNDEELLRCAAKAAGFVEPHSYRPQSNSLLWLGKESGAATWRPFDDDAEAFRLAVQLKLLIQTDLDGDPQVSTNDYDVCEWYPSGSDRYAATRRAIVMAAAEIGKNI